HNRPATALSPRADLYDLLVGLSGLVRAHVRTTAAEAGLTPLQSRALRLLDVDNPVPMNELATLLRCDPSYVTGIVDRLEELGWVERRPSASDRRVKTLALTPLGLAHQAELGAKLRALPPAIAALSRTDPPD